MQIIREMQIKTRDPSPKNSQTVNAGEGVKRKPSYTVGGNVNWYSHYGKHMWVPKETENSYHRSWNPTPGHYLEKNMVRKDTCAPMFIAVLLTIAEDAQCYVAA